MADNLVIVLSREGHLKIAQQFTAGKMVQENVGVPEGRLNAAWRITVQTVPDLPLRTMSAASGEDNACLCAYQDRCDRSSHALEDGLMW
jgi:hypothetical protein